MLAASLVAPVLAAELALVMAGCGGGAGAVDSTPARTSPSAVPARTAPPSTSSPAPEQTSTRPRPPFAVGLRVLTFFDRRRLVRLPGGSLGPRKLVTLVRYPATGSPTGIDLAGAPPERAAGPFPLVVFGHGFAVTPAIYARLLRAWARAGYVVAAPVFPRENASAPGGPNESDLPNQPGDMSVVISRMLAASADDRSVFARLIDPRAIAVSGQSDGGETALAVAYDGRFLDRRVRAAVILSGAQIPHTGPLRLAERSAPMLATQGTGDVVNPPNLTDAFFGRARRPKYLLTLIGAPHLGPYTTEQPQLGIVERVTIAFLDRYLKRAAGAARRLVAGAHVPGVSVLHAKP